MVMLELDGKLVIGDSGKSQGLCKYGQSEPRRLEREASDEDKSIAHFPDREISVGRHWRKKSIFISTRQLCADCAHEVQDLRSW